MQGLVLIWIQFADKRKDESILVHMTILEGKF